MTKKSMVLFFGAVLLVVGVFAIPTPASASEACDAAQKKIQDWVEANAAHLPTELKGLSRHPVAYRKAIFSTLTAEQKTSLWREHIQQYIATHPHLSDKQVDVLESVLAILTPKLFSNPGAVDSAAVEAAVVEAFGADEARAIVATLGPVEAPEDVQPALAPLCQCSKASPYCGNFACRSYSCRRQASGCGSWWNDPCDGLCG